jgi:hypothetical protein
MGLHSFIDPAYNGVSMEGNPTMSDEETVYEIKLIRSMERATIDARRWDEALPLRAMTLHASNVNTIAHANISEMKRLKLYTETLKNVSYAVNGTTERTGDVLSRLRDELVRVHDSERMAPIE